ncbi:16S rRNA (cytidine(1402)-2'-O)-methyltransferase [Mobiluncus curtisii]|uniref:16S rRNA (cytidine(1402)-2'-O)-methyltransferase n=1 Tax=Mobiluncus curtisii TaxID=2051 RepID=UPI0001E0C405|nr:16S rRNA (cytidine(1402)-2'-O)-methyltransferase [Mobiluncus curtisii]EFL93278.1 S-adenosylmethionine-dependent methyltransferase, YraL family [Mobiluncus curtisii subsp. curtisii ATCC 35241]NMW88231.1 16S rRNA (cytidine(1402)-2'-O)-methyltransferase [Mobiluncus curtisii]QQT14112.1 16S rRNA (cytidine(1402)-2'-O)-methyltransferase [Mobiluncus curtisii]STY76459.1 Ribosomal RNA small subunit methyltransferase I [Mobiluncus curtisii subsp. curtisii]
MDYPPVFEEVNLVLAGTPIGNVGDSSPRLREALRDAEVVACEDTRRTRDLAHRLRVEMSARLLAYHEHNEATMTPELLNLARDGKRVLQVSDAGMPGISDPGFRLGHAAGNAGIPFTVLPGPSAPLLALVGSGLPTDSFTFVGFLPRKFAALYHTLQSLSARNESLIFLESPRRTVETLDAMVQVFGANRPTVVARELTKTHEEFIRGTLESVHSELCSRLEVLGEIVIVVQGATAGNESADSTLHLDKLEQLVQNGVKAKTAAKLIATWFGGSANELFSSYLEGKNG